MDDGKGTLLSNSITTHQAGSQGKNIDSKTVKEYATTGECAPVFALGLRLRGDDKKEEGDDRQEEGMTEKKQERAEGVQCPCLVMYPQRQKNQADTADNLLSSVSRFLMNVRVWRGRSRISRDEYILERKLIVLLDDLRVALRKNDPTDFDALAKAVNRSWIELYEMVSGRRS